MLGTTILEVESHTNIHRQLYHHIPVRRCMQNSMDITSSSNDPVCLDDYSAQLRHMCKCTQNTVANFAHELQAASAYQQDDG